MDGYEVSSGQEILRHIFELRRRIFVGLAAFLVCMAFSFIFNRQILALLIIPLQSLNNRGSVENLLFVNTLFEGFLTKVKLSAISGIILSLPVHLFNILRFVFPGLTRRERRMISLSLIVSSVLIAFSFYYGYFKVIPLSVAFLSSSGFIPENIGMLLNYSRNIFYILQFLLATLVVFQIPVILEVLLVMGVLRRHDLMKASRYIMVGTFVLSALLTPPDFVSQLSLAIPLIALFFLTIAIAKIFHFGE